MKFTASLRQLNSRSKSLCGATSVALVVIAIGCGQARGPQLTPKIKAETPEAKLELVMDRLQTAIVDASAASSSGVISQRRSSHRLIPPAEPSGQYKAEVTIKTTRALAKGATSEVEEEEEVEDSEVPEEEESTETEVTARAIEHSRDVQIKKYELGYIDEQWTLLTEPGPDDEVAKYLFEYALSD